MTPELLSVPVSLSPRLRWIQTHGVLTHRSEMERELPWIALIPMERDKGKDIFDCMADNCRLYDEGNLLGYGQTEDEALYALAAKLNLKTWNQP